MPDPVKNDKKYRHIPVIMVSTSSHQKDANVALDMGALCLFTKPDFVMELKDILKVLVANVDGNLLQSISHFSAIKSKKILARPDINKKN